MAAEQDGDDAALAKLAKDVGLTLGAPRDLTITRRRAGRGFRYLDAKGRPVRDAATLERIDALAIPPAYEEVRIARDANVHLQAIGRDEAGRAQYRYHPDWNAVRELKKVERLDRVIEALPKLRRRVARDLASPRLSRAKALAAAVALIDETHIRVGCEAYVRSNKAHGASTLLKRHVKVKGEAVQLAFRGKGGKDISCSIRSGRLARAVGRIGALPGRRLFQYRDADGAVRRITAVDVNAYLREATGLPVTAKDLRMLGASANAAEHLAELEPATSPTARRRQLSAVMRAISERLANTPAVVRKSYVHAVVVDGFGSGSLKKAYAGARGRSGLRRAEAALAGLVRRLKRGR
ncbi:DNA topoisomerase I [Methylopila jiangsuensis]|uniref:DNA topoisomerase I n=1 Tax=Methylopila jiangsuensis TaxID=586230 RepID=A0A9W6JHR4_9HYPH|nr:DNA topoisomerase IB [Methylopila jiangsuensis]MDR6284193.1 DNA topoisomerase-1 [Methylopila jiangsuensis]GLK76289.1 DNA topoisomerase I [Methylopila jiangsuensis]